MPQVYYLSVKVYIYTDTDLSEIAKLLISNP